MKFREFKIDANKKYLFYSITFSAIFGLIAQILSYSYSYIFYYRDAIYRLEKARSFFDAVNPGFFKQLGTGWLPISHLLMAPLASINFLWYTGLAGSIIGYICFVLSTLLIYLILSKYFKHNLSILIGVIVYTLNPNLLYFQTTALTEQPYLLFTTSSFYLIVQFFEIRKIKYLIYSGLMLMLAMGIRYDGWVIYFVSFFFLIFIDEGIKNKVRTLFYFSIFPIAFLIFWLIYNYFQYGDAFEFARGIHSTFQQLKYYEQTGRLLTKHNIIMSFDVTFKDIEAYIGIIFTIFTFFGIILYILYNKRTIYQNKNVAKSFLPYLLLIPAPVLFLLLYSGQIIIELPNTFPSGYFNSRYAIYVLPCVAFFIAFFIEWLITNKNELKNLLFIISIIAILFQQFDYYYSYPDHIPALAEAKFCNNETTQKLTKYLCNNYDNGKILYDFNVFALSPMTRINIKDRVTYFTPDVGKEAINDPKLYVKWVLFYQYSINDSIYNSLKDNKKFFVDYMKVFSYDGVSIYKTK